MGDDYGEAKSPLGFQRDFTFKKERREDFTTYYGIEDTNWNQIIWILISLLPTMQPQRGSNNIEIKGDFDFTKISHSTKYSGENFVNNAIE